MTVSGLFLHKLHSLFFFHIKIIHKDAFSAFDQFSIFQVRFCLISVLNHLHIFPVLLHCNIQGNTQILQTYRFYKVVKNTGGLGTLNEVVIGISRDKNAGHFEFTCTIDLLKGLNTIQNGHFNILYR